MAGKTVASNVPTANEPTNVRRVIMLRNLSRLRWIQRTSR
jgi:hypothetical protein